MWRLSFGDFNLADRRMHLLFGRDNERPAGEQARGTREQQVELGLTTHRNSNVERCSRTSADTTERDDKQDDVVPRQDAIPTGLQENPLATVLLPQLVINKYEINKATAIRPLPRDPNHLNSLSTVTSAHHIISPFTSRTSTLMDYRNGADITELRPLPHSGVYDLPPASRPSLIQRARYAWFTVYRRLNIVCIMANLIPITILRLQNRLLQLPLAWLATVTTVNFLVSILVRQEFVINALFIAAGHCPRSMPLRIRRLCAKIYHLGGVHSGAALGGTTWFTVFSIVMFTKDQSDFTSNARRKGLWGLTGILDGLLLATCAAAIPQFRAKQHNWFECIHRFGGWTAVAGFWAISVLLCFEAAATFDHRSVAKIYFTSPVFYMLLVITFFLILPWLYLRKVPVVAERFSDHAIRLHFDYTNDVPLCSAPRITDRPLFEWHAFASIPEANGRGFSLLVSNSGDWTSRIINNPPTHLYKRGWLSRGVMNVAPIFSSLVMVATGSGIGPVLSLLKGAPHLTGIRMIWSTKDPLHHYHPSVVAAVYAADPHAFIFNTDTMPRPNLVPLAHELYTTSQAEAVFVISNALTTRKIVYGLESRGVPTFAPIFDS